MRRLPSGNLNILWMWLAVPTRVQVVLERLVFACFALREHRDEAAARHRFVDEPDRAFARHRQRHERVRETAPCRAAATRAARWAAGRPGSRRTTLEGRRGSSNLSRSSLMSLVTMLHQLRLPDQKTPAETVRSFRLGARNGSECRRLRHRRSLLIGDAGLYPCRS